ncbi:MAG TPA: DUF4198 domain-containing protein [Dyella sp.]|uniref:DUF4198 domain-containing protein n=1 Tax=Dyella sp. TaxID=1869338 RepID=UPI002F94FBB1
MNHLGKYAIALAALAVPLAAQAHKMWLLPSATSVAGNDPWITVDAAVSNDLFFADHMPGALDRLVIIAPNGQPIQAENAFTGKYRSVFDVHLTQQGTYKIAMLNRGALASYELNGEKKRWRGNPVDMTKALPVGAKNVEVTESISRVETFVSNGKPNDAALKPSGDGIEMVPVTAVNDLVAGEPASFRLLLDGKPAANLEVTAIAGATRYRNAPEEIKATTDSDGKFTLTWPHAGMYWVNANTQDRHTQISQAKQRRVAYSATLEVLPE